MEDSLLLARTLKEVLLAIRFADEHGGVNGSIAGHIAQVGRLDLVQLTGVDTGGA